jgi:type IV secretion system protein TrbL
MAAPHRCSKTSSFMTRRVEARLTIVVTLVAAALLGPLSGVVGAQDNGRCDAGVFDKPCELAKGAGDKIGSGVSNVVSAPFEAAGNSIMNQLTTWVAEAAVSLIGRIVEFMESSTTPRLTSEWFSDRYELMMGLGLLVLLPLLLIAAIRALLHQDMGQLLKSFFLYVPVAILATFVAIHLTQMLLAITDDLSAAVSESVGGDATRFLEGGAGSVASALGGVTGGFLMFFGALLVVVAGLLLWIQLLIRSAAIYVCVFFLPLVLAGLVWPATARWTKRLIETLIALILSKFVIVAIISLAVAAMGRPLSESGGGGVGTVIGGASLLLLAAFSPFALFKLIPLAEAHSIGHLEGMERRPGHALQGGGGFSVQSFVRDKVASGRAAQGIGGASGAGAGAGAASAATAGGAVAVMAAKKGAGAPGRQLERQSEIVTPAGEGSPRRNDSGKARGGQLQPPAPSKAKRKTV